MRNVEVGLYEYQSVRSGLFCPELLAAPQFNKQGVDGGTCKNRPISLIAWDADLRIVDGSFEHWRFSGTSWQRRSKAESQRYLENVYRVVLTRAREGMVIFVPEGDADDATRLPEFYQGIADYLAECGVKMIEGRSKNQPS